MRYITQLTLSLMKTVPYLKIVNATASLTTIATIGYIFVYELPALKESRVVNIETLEEIRRSREFRELERRLIGETLAEISESRQMRNLELQARRRAEINDAWEVVHAPRTGFSGKRSSLKLLYREGEPLNGLDVSCEKMGGTFDSTIPSFAECDAPPVLSGLDLSGASLRNANFSGTDLRGASFENADLADANFSGAILEDANFSNANLINSKFVGTQVYGADFRNSNMTGMEMSGFGWGPDEITAFEDLASLEGAWYWVKPTWAYPYDRPFSIQLPDQDYGYRNLSWKCLPDFYQGDEGEWQPVLLASRTEDSRCFQHR